MKTGGTDSGKEGVAALVSTQDGEKITKTAIEGLQRKLEQAKTFDEFEMKAEPLQLSDKKLKRITQFV
jgi:hypothetical protein